MATALPCTPTLVALRLHSVLSCVCVCAHVLPNHVSCTVHAVHLAHTRHLQTFEFHITLLQLSISN